MECNFELNGVKNESYIVSIVDIDVKDSYLSTEESTLQVKCKILEGEFTNSTISVNFPFKTYYWCRGSTENSVVYRVINHIRSMCNLSIDKLNVWRNNDFSAEYCYTITPIAELLFYTSMLTDYTRNIKLKLNCKGDKLNDILTMHN